MDEGNQKDVYLCFNTADREWTRNLAAQLESETIDGLPKSRKLTVFFDEWDIDSGENLIKRMNEGLESSRFVAVVLSPEFMKAPWPSFEWTHIVSLDPINDQKRLIPLLRRDVSLDGKAKIALPAPFRALRYIDFRNSAQANTKYAEFVRRIRGLPLQRGAPRTPLAGISPSLVGDEPEESWLPDKVQDVLLGNLLPVASLPRTIWSAETAARKKGEVFAQVEHAEGFILKDKRLYTFGDLTVSGTALRGIVDTKTVQTASRHEWFIQPDRSRWLMNLLNRYLAGYLSRLAIKQERRGRYFFRPHKDGTDRMWENPGDPRRAVAAKKTNQTDGGHFWVHHAARIKFKRIGNGVFLMVEPTYLFTSDGQNPLEGQETGKLAIMWGGRQKNVDILRNFAFWIRTMSNGSPKITIPTGSEPIVVAAAPATARLGWGVKGDAVRISSLLKQVDTELDEAAKDVVVAPQTTDDHEADHDNQSS